MFCSGCGNEVQQNAQFCMHCGVNVQKSSVSFSEDPNTRSNIYCRNCGEEIDKNSDFCIHCGTRPLNATSFCQTCGVETGVNQEICTSCGVRLKHDPNSHPILTNQKEKQRSKLALISLALSILYLLYIFGIILYLFSEYSYMPTYMIIEGMLISLLPHVVLVIPATVMNALGYFLYSKWFVLAGAVLYTFSILTYPLNAVFVIIQTVLSFISFVQDKKEEDTTLKQEYKLD